MVGKVKATKCSVPDCEYNSPIKRIVRGYCWTHYYAKRRSGELKAIRTQRVLPNFNSAQERYEYDLIKIDHDCWSWKGHTDKGGYGVFIWNGQNVKIHRFSYEQANGVKLDSDTQVDHKCWNPICSNPEHLQLKDAQQNNENRKGANSSNPSKYRGVTWNEEKNAWRVRATVKGKSYHGGYFKDLEAANKAAIALRNRVMTNNLADRI